MIQALFENGGRMARRRYELTDKEWLIIEPLLPNKPRGVPRVDDRRVLNGILWRFRSGAPWAEIPERYGPSTTCYNRFVRWRKAGVWDRLLAAVSAGFNGELVMIDSTCMRVHQHGATGKKGGLEIMAWDVPGAASRPSSTLLSTLMDVLSACD
jgi:transposase